METAIVMPLFLFILLGLIQLGLLHQARLLTKYAAYKAVRAGSLNRGDLQVMRNAAVAVMMPVLSQNSPIARGNGRTQNQYAVYNVSTPGRYRRAYNEVISSRNNVAFGHRMVDVTICTPLRGNSNQDFDDPQVNPNDWRGFDNTKLAIQVTTYAVLYIPYANAFIWWAARGQEGAGSAARVRAMRMLRMKGKPQADRGRYSPNNSWTLPELDREAQAGNYVMPVRASYTLRMQSNFKVGMRLPSVNDCHINWIKE